MPAALYPLATLGTSSVFPSNWLTTAFVFPPKAFTAPIKQLLDMLSKWPLYLNHGPAIEMWSVVHFPSAFIKSFAPVIFSSFQGVKGVSNCNLLDSGLTTILIPLPSSAGAWYPLSSTANPWDGNSVPWGSDNLTCSPFWLVSVSVIGLKSNLPEIAIAATISGEPTNACVFGFPSARLAKFLLKEWTIVFFSCLLAPSLSHCPIHGPQALVNILVVSNFINESINPSLSAVKRTCSEPGLIPNVALGFSPLLTASSTIEAALVKSS